MCSNVCAKSLQVDVCVWRQKNVFRAWAYLTRCMKAAGTEPTPVAGGRSWSYFKGNGLRSFAVGHYIHIINPLLEIFLSHRCRNSMLYILCMYFEKGFSYYCSMFILICWMCFILSNGRFVNMEMSGHENTMWPNMFWIHFHLKYCFLCFGKIMNMRFSNKNGRCLQVFFYSENVIVCLIRWKTSLVILCVFF